MPQWDVKLINDTIKLMFSRTHWWIYPCAILLGGSVGSFLSDNYWIWLLFGILTFPIAVLATASDSIVIRNKKRMRDTIKYYVETKK